MNKSRYTLTDVAQRAGVSVATVSRVLSNHPHVKNATRERVKRALVEMRFDPQAMYTPFVQQTTPMVGFLIPAAMATLGLNRAVYLTMVQTIREAVEARGFGLYVGTFSGSADGDLVGDRVIRERQIAGAIVSRVRSDEELEPLRRAGLTVVVLNRPVSSPGIHTVTVNNRRAAAEAADHVIQQGHRRIGVLGGPEDVYSAAERLAGYHDAMQAAGLDPTTLTIARTDLAEEQGRRATAELLERPRPPTAILAVNDYLALAAIDVATSRGLHLPDDLSIVGFDDIESARYVHPALTTVHMPWDRMAHWAGRILLDALEDERAEQASLRMTTELVIRASTTRPPTTLQVRKQRKTQEVFV
ncbi:MAG TPA: LacI family DNA-binding transcriptional regulator [Chloroflexota bacterium]|nr:LacI family DNA-binding transcriptional regulator [Chloroflexota bacterium]